MFVFHHSVNKDFHYCRLSFKEKPPHKKFERFLFKSILHFFLSSKYSGYDPYYAPAAVFCFNDIRLLQGQFNHPLRDLVHQVDLC